MAVKKRKVVKKKVKKTKAARPAAKKKAAKKKVSKKIPAQPKPNIPAAPMLKTAGEVTHFFPHVSAAVIKLSGPLKVGDMIQIKGHTTDFKQSVDSMQIEHVPVNEAKKGDEIGLKVKDRVRIGDTAYIL